MLDVTASRPRTAQSRAILRLPTLRAGMVDRPGAVWKLRTSSASIATIVAPAGYGATTLLSQWSAEDPRPFAYLAVDAEHNDPAVLLTHLSEALDRIVVVNPYVFEVLESPDGNSLGSVTEGLGAAVATSPLPVALAIDNLHLLDNEEALHPLAIIGSYVPYGSLMVLASRSQSSVAPLLGRGWTLELGVADLSLDAEQVAEVLSNQGLEPSDEDVTTILDQTEGWPVAVRAAASSLRDGTVTAAPDFLGDIQPVAQYLRSEILDPLSRRDILFLLRTAVLERLSGDLCDSVLGTSGSATTLRRLESSALPLVPMDAEREWYRYHHLVRQFLGAQLDQRRPEERLGLLTRAADWYEANDLPEEAARYAMEIGDADRVARIFSANAHALSGAGRASIALDWLDWLENHASLANRRDVLPAAIWFEAFEGRSAGADRRAEMLDHIVDRTDVRGEDPSLRSSAATVRAALCRDGVEHMRRDAELALADPESIWHPAALLMAGVASELDGRQKAAAEVLADAQEDAERKGQADVALAALGERMLIAVELGSWSVAESLLQKASSIRSRHGLDRSIISALVLALSARTALHRGDRDRANRALIRATALRPQLTRAFPWFAVQTMIELARAFIDLADAGGARTILQQIDSVLRRRPRLGNLPQQVDELRPQVDGIRARRLRITAITDSELRLLPHLTSHLTFGEIGEVLSLSPHTVKTQAISIYRKLGVTSRTAAIERGREIGIIEP